MGMKKMFRFVSREALSLQPAGVKHVCFTPAGWSKACMLYSY